MEILFAFHRLLPAIVPAKRRTEALKQKSLAQKLISSSVCYEPNLYPHRALLLLRYPHVDLHLTLSFVEAIRHDDRSQYSC